MNTLTENHPALNPENQPAAPARPVLKLGLDVHLQWIVAVTQEGHQTPRSPRKFTRPKLADHVRKQVGAGFEVWCVQERSSASEVSTDAAMCETGGLEDGARGGAESGGPEAEGANVQHTAAKRGKPRNGQGGGDGATGRWGEEADG